jgi:hypothetical protein
LVNPPPPKGVPDLSYEYTQRTLWTLVLARHPLGIRREFDRGARGAVRCPDDSTKASRPNAFLSRPAGGLRLEREGGCGRRGRPEMPMAWRGRENEVLSASFARARAPRPCRHLRHSGWCPISARHDSGRALSRCRRETRAEHAGRLGSGEGRRSLPISHRTWFHRCCLSGADSGSRAGTRRPGCGKAKALGLREG